MISDEELKGMCYQVANMLRQEIAAHKTPSAIVICSYHEGEGLNRMRKLEALLAQRCGPHWLADADKKARAYGSIRLATAMAREAGIEPPGAMIFGHPARWGTVSTAFPATPWPPPDAINGIAVTAQTPERICIYTQADVGEVQAEFYDQAHFDGRMKMFGPLPEHLQKIKDKIDSGAL